MQQFIIAIRNIRGEMNIAPGKLLNVILSHGTELDKQRVQAHEHSLKQQAKLQSLSWLAPLGQHFLSFNEYILPSVNY